MSLSRRVHPRMRALGGALGVAVGALASADPLPLTAQTAGSYLAVRIDTSPLPLADRVTDADGTTYLVEFERLVLSLRAGNRFRASVRFRRSLTTSDTRGRGRATPIQSMTVSGAYVITGKAITFAPDTSSETQGLRIMAGRVDGPLRITVPFDYRNGAASRHRVLELHRRDDIL